MGRYHGRKGKLFVFSGPSGAGKGTICKALIDRDEEKRLAVSISMTTRPPRTGEVHGENYYFVTKDEFDIMVRDDGFLEYAKVYGNFYGTPKKMVMDLLEEGIDVILEIDIQGAMNVKKAFPEGVFIFILPPSMSELRKRITDRGTDSAETIELRMSETLKELTYIDKYDYCVVNGELSEAVRRAEAIVIAERSKVTADVYDIIEGYKEEN